MPPLLALETLTVGYTADRPLVRNLCFTWEGGALIAVVGGNGS